MEYEVRAGWLFTIDALEKGVGKKGYMTTAEGWTMLMEGGSVDSEEASDALYLLEQESFVLVESEDGYDEFMHEYFPIRIELTEKGKKLIREISRDPRVTAFIDGLTNVETIVKEIADATPTIRAAIKWVVSSFVKR